MGKRQGFKANHQNDTGRRFKVLSLPTSGPLKVYFKDTVVNQSFADETDRKKSEGRKDLGASYCILKAKETSSGTELFNDLQPIKGS